ncbi:MAG: Ig-like domain repeat protein, partial [Proteobacteria bacterium]|nr:Ig-like domain repeat protein [Pseudomonadota bacterium]
TSFPITAVASPNAGGSVSCSPNPVTQGGVASCTATAASGYTLASISGCGGTTSTTSPYATGPVNAACTVTATFTANTVTSFPITAVASPNAGGSVSCSPNPVTQGGVASCTATAASGYTLTNISGCGGTTSTTSPYATGPVNAACTVTATFTANTVTSFPITAVASPNAGGSVTCSPNPVTQGGVASCTATAASGYTLASISGCGGTTSTTSPYATGAINAACTVTATFTANTVTSFPITTVASPNAGGSVSCTPNPVTQGGVASCTVTTANGYTLSTISGCGGTASTTSPYATGAINAACTVTATFTPVSAVFTISLTSSPNPSLTGQSVTFIATVTQAEPTNAARTTATSDDATNVAAAVTGSVIFTDNGLPLATVVLNAQGVATYQISSLGAGSHTIVATFGSNSATTSSVTQQVQAIAPTTAATPAPALSLSMLLLLACAVALLAIAAVRGVAPNPRG